MKRRKFLFTTAGAAVGASVLANPVSAAIAGKTKKKICLIGTGVRGT